MTIQVVRRGTPRSMEEDFAIGCYCEHEARCHRSVLRELLAELGATII